MTTSRQGRLSSTAAMTAASCPWARRSLWSTRRSTAAGTAGGFMVSAVSGFEVCCTVLLLHLLFNLRVDFFHVQVLDGGDEFLELRGVQRTRLAEDQYVFPESHQRRNRLDLEGGCQFHFRF